MDELQKKLWKQRIQKFPGGKLVIRLRQWLKRGRGRLSAATLQAYAAERDYCLQAWQKYTAVPVAAMRVLEVGSGSSLALAVALSAQVRQVVTVDVVRWCRRSQLRQAMRYFAVTPAVGTSRQHNLGLPANVDYCAPVVLAQLALPPASFDVAVAQVTLEHVPVAELPALSACVWRLLKPQGVWYCTIDYTDHRADGKQISIYDYLRYEPDVWPRFDRSWSHQNRLRTPDYQQLFTAAGFEIKEIFPWLPSAAELAVFQTIPLASCFAHYSQTDLQAKGATFVLQKS